MTKLTTIIILTAISLFSWGQQWTTLNSGTLEWLRGVYFFNEDTGLVVGYGGTILRTIDGGVNWDTIPSGTSEDFLSITFHNQTGLITGNGGTILKSTNGGLSWTDKSSANTIWHQAQLLNEHTAYIVGESSTVLKTIDGGDNWIFLTSGTGNGRVSLFFNDVNTGFVVGIGDDDAIMKTTDGGNNWNFIHDNTFNEFSSVLFKDFNNGFVCSSTEGTIKRTANAGSSWQTVNSNTTKGLYSIKFPSSTIGYIAGGYPNESIVLGTTDGGSTWHNHNTNNANPLFDIFFVNENLGYAVGMNGTIIKTTNGAVGIQNPSVAQFSISAFPNPTTDYVTIKVEPQRGLNMEIILTDITGRAIKQVQIQEGESIDLRDFVNGVYVLSVNAGRFVETKRITKE